APRLDLTGWLDFAMSGTASSAPAAGGSGLLAGIDLQSPAMSAWERDFGAANVKLVPVNGGLDIAFGGDAVEGTLHVPIAELRQRGITAQFTRLYWPAVAEPSDGD